MEAYGSPARPNWEAARLFTGQTPAEDGEVPTLRTCVAKEAKEESDIISARHKARELKGMTSSRLPDDGPADADASATSGKGRGGRGNRNRKQGPAAPAAGDA